MRHIPGDLLAEFSARTNKPESFLIQGALAMVGVEESGGDNKGKWIELMQGTISKPTAQSWCLDFIQSVIAFAEWRSGVTSPLPAIELCTAFFEQAPSELKLKQPEPGTLVVWQKEGSAQGHVGLVLCLVKTGYYTVEGNTSDGTGIDRDGDGVYVRYRPFGGQGKMKELGFLRVFSP